MVRSTFHLSVGGLTVVRTAQDLEPGFYPLSGQQSETNFRNVTTGSRT